MSSSQGFSYQPPPSARHARPRGRRAGRGLDRAHGQRPHRTHRGARRAAGRRGRQTLPSPRSNAISPLARRLAAELGVDVDALAARMPGKRIERADVEAEARLRLRLRLRPAQP